MKRAIEIVIAILLPVWLAAPAAAQPPPPRQPAPAPYPTPPRSAFQFRLGVFQPEGDSDFWDETESTFTLDARDLDGLMLGFTYLRPFSNTVELGINLDFFDEDESSSVRGLLGPPVVHQTELWLTPLTFDVRFIPGGRYRVRPGGRFVLKPLFYVGAGAGLNFWEYEEYGHFYDFFADEVIHGDFQDDGITWELHVLAGGEFPVGRRSNLLLEARYSLSEDDLGGDFGGLENTNIDLGGTALFGGVSVRF